MRIIHVPEKKGYKVKVSWINVTNPANHYACGIVEEIFIPTVKIREWELCIPEQTKAPILEAISDTFKPDILPDIYMKRY